MARVSCPRARGAPRSASGTKRWSERAGTYLDGHRLEVAMDEEAVNALGGDGAHFNGRWRWPTSTRAAPLRRPPACPSVSICALPHPRLDGASPDLVYLSSASSFAVRGSSPPGGRDPRSAPGHVHRRRRRVPLRAGGRGHGLCFRTEARLEIARRSSHPPGSLRRDRAPAQHAARRLGTGLGAPRTLALTLGPRGAGGDSQVRRGNAWSCRGAVSSPRTRRPRRPRSCASRGLPRAARGAVPALARQRRLELLVDFVSGSELRYVLRVFQTPPESSPAWASCRHLHGQIFPVLVRGRRSSWGGARGATRDPAAAQVVYLKFLPALPTPCALSACETWSWRSANGSGRCAARLRALERGVPRGAAHGLLEYEVVEIGGPDPNQQGLFGLDNTTGKDLGNLRFNDVIGATTPRPKRRVPRLRRHLPGVLPRPLAPRARTAPHRQPTLRPDLRSLSAGSRGTPVAAGEYPEDPRRFERIAEAIRVLGNLVGTTVTHEIGHTLGMVIAQGYFHNPCQVRTSSWTRATSAPSRRGRSWRAKGRPNSSRARAVPGRDPPKD